MEYAKAGTLQEKISYHKKEKKFLKEEEILYFTA